MDRRVVAVVLVAVCLASAALPAGVTAQSGTTYTYPAGEKLTATDGPTVELQENITVATDYDWFPDRSTVDLPNRGRVTADASGGYVEVANWTQTTTTARNIDANGTTMTINPDGKNRIGVAGDIDRIEWSDYQLDDGESDFTYAGPDGTTSEVVVYGLPGDTAIAAVSGGEQLDTVKTNANGRARLTLPNSEHTVSLQTISTDRPQLENPDPQGEQSTAPSELRVTVDDAQFETTDEAVNVTIDLDGSQVKQTTITNETRVTASVGSLSSGTHTWTVKATDSFNETTTKTYEFGVPASLEIRNVSAPNSLVTESVDVRIYRQDNTTILTETVSNGTLDLSGLPAKTTLLLEFTNASNYTDRTILVQRLSQNQTAYLLPESSNRKTVRFVLDDNTGRYDESTSQLLVKAPLTVNNSTKYRTVIGERFGASGVTQPLRTGERYRLVVRNQAGDVYVPGHYRTEINETATIVVRPQEGESRGGDQPYTWDASQATVEDANDSVVFEFSDPENETQNLDLRIARRGNGTTVATYQFDGPIGNVTIAEEVNESYEDGGYVVEWDAQRGDEEIGARTVVGSGTLILPTLALFWRQTFVAGVLLLTGGAFSQANAAAGGVVVAVLGGIFWFIGWLTGAAAGAVVLVLAIAAVWKLRSGGVI